MKTIHALNEMHLKLLEGKKTTTLFNKIMKNSTQTRKIPFQTFNQSKMMRPYLNRSILISQNSLLEISGENDFFFPFASFLFHTQSNTKLIGSCVSRYRHIQFVLFQPPPVSFFFLLIIVLLMFVCTVIRSLAVRLLSYGHHCPLLQSHDTSFHSFHIIVITIIIFFFFVLSAQVNCSLFLN